MLQNTQDTWFVVKTYLLEAPAAGSDFTFTPNPGYRTQIIGVQFTLATDINAADRLVALQIEDGTNNYHRTLSPVIQTALESNTYNFAVGLPTIDLTATLPLVQGGLPEDLFLHDGETFNSNVISGQAADAITSIAIRVKEWEVLFPEVARSIRPNLIS